MMFFSSIKIIYRLESKRMSNIYLKVTRGKRDVDTQNFNFLNLKSSCPGQFLGSSNSRRSHRIFYLRFQSKNMCGFSIYYLNFGRKYDNGTIDKYLPSHLTPCPPPPLPQPSCS